MAWVANYAPIYPGSHPQRGRIVRALYRQTALSGDRLTNLEGMGTLGDDSGYVSADDEAAAGLEKDTDWGALVTSIVNAGGKVAPAAISAFTVAQKSKGLSLDTINQMLAAANARAAGVANGTASMPSSNTILLVGGGLLAVVLLALVLGRK